MYVYYILSVCSPDMISDIVFFLQIYFVFRKIVRYCLLPVPHQKLAAYKVARRQDQHSTAHDTVFTISYLLYFMYQQRQQPTRWMLIVYTTTRDLVEVLFHYV
jgi:hypothetical protein